MTPKELEKLEELNKKLLKAAQEENYGELLNALNEGADVNARGIDKQTALHKASFYGNVEIALLLIKAGADVNLQDNFGETALHLAATYNRASYLNSTAIALLLINTKANVNIINNNKKTTLHHAAELGYTAITQELIKAGADVNLQDDHGETALHSAAHGSFIFINASQFDHATVKALIEAGADVNLQDDHGGTESPISLIAGEPALIEKIIHEASLLIVDAIISERKHCDAVKELLNQLQSEQNAKAQSAKAGVNIDTTQVAAKKSATQTQDSVMNCLQKAAYLFGEGLEGINNAFFPTEHRSHAKNVTKSRSDPQQAKGVCSIS